MNQELLAQACKTLHFAHVMSHYESVPFENRTDFLLAILQSEIQGRESSKLKRLMKRARFPQLKMFEGYNFETISFPNHCTKQSLKSLQFLKHKQNILILGKVGTGKTHLAIAIGVGTCR